MSFQILRACTNLQIYTVYKNRKVDRENDEHNRHFIYNLYFSLSGLLFILDANIYLFCTSVHTWIGNVPKNLSTVFDLFGIKFCPTINYDIDIHLWHLNSFYHCHVSTPNRSFSHHDSHDQWTAKGLYFVLKTPNSLKCFYYPGSLDAGSHPVGKQLSKMKKGLIGLIGISVLRCRSFFFFFGSS